MRGSYRVRRIRPDEGAPLRAVRLKALSGDPGAFGTALETALTYDYEMWVERAVVGSAGGDAAVLVAESDGSIRAMVGAFVRHGDGFATLYGMWVAPELRGNGTATALVHAVDP